MAINLQKGGRINLAKTAPALKRVRLDLGWKENAFNSGEDFDLDATVFICKNVLTNPADPDSAEPKLISDEHFVFYRNLNDPEGATTHSGDNKTGGSGVCESVTVELAKLHSQAVELSFIVSIYEAHERKQNFGQVSKSFIALSDADTGVELGRYSLEDDFSNETSVQFGSLVKKADGWTFVAVGAGYDLGLDKFVVKYGGNLA